MKINTTTILTGIDGENLVNGDEPLTLRKVIQTSLLTVMTGDEKLDGGAKADLWNLACDARADEVDWSPETVAKVRARIGKGYGPAVVGPAFKLLD